MLTTIIEKEIREIFGSSKFVLIFGSCAVLILLSFYVGAKNYKLNRAKYEAAQAENLRQFEGLTDWFNIQQHRIFLPPDPLASLVSGVSHDIGRNVDIHGRGEINPLGSRFSEDPVFAVFRFLDLEFIFGTILSLFAILMGYDAIAGEKERGTLRLSFANAVPRPVYILGKLTGSFVALAVPLVLALAVGALILPAMGLPLSGESWLRLISICAIGLLYFGVFLAMSVFVSSLTEWTSSAFLVLLVVWICAVLIVPRASVLIAGRAVDVPSVDEIASQKNIFSRQLYNEDHDKMSSFKPSDSEDMENVIDEFNRYMEQLAEERERKMREFSERLNEKRSNAQRNQHKLALNIARLSPATSLSLATTQLAGTSVDMKSRFKGEAERYQEQYGNFIKEKTGVKPGGRMIMMRIAEDEGEEPEPVDPAELPVFEYKRESLAHALDDSILDAGLLAVYNLIFFAAAFVAFVRYDVR